jgi:hypothetical protein
MWTESQPKRYIQFHAIEKDKSIIHQNIEIYHFSRSKLEPYSTDILKKRLSFPAASRVFLPLAEEYSDLKIKKSSLNWNIAYLQDIDLIKNHGAMLLPFFYHKTKSIDTRSLDKLCHWVKENAENSSITPERVRELYEKMINWIDNDIMKNEPSWHEKRTK